MSPPLAPRQAWRSTGIQPRTVSSQRPQWISNVRMILRQRNLSVSAVNHEENRQDPAVSRSEEDMSTPRPPSTTDNSDAAASDLGPAAAGKPKKPHSLKDIFPDLFRDSKPHVSQSSTRDSREDWEKSLDESMRDPDGMISNIRRPARPSPTAIGSKLSSILHQKSSDTDESARKSRTSMTGGRDRTRAAPKELQAFHELLESMFEASEAQAAESGRSNNTIHKSSDFRRDDYRFGMDSSAVGRDSYLSDAMAGRRYQDRRETGTQSYEQRSTPWIMPTAKRVGGFRAVTEAEMEDYMQKRELITSLRTDLEILEWLNRTYFDANAETSTSAEASHLDATSTSSFTASYPLVLAYTISVLHLRFRNPHAALAVFEIARSFSLESYLVGCTTAVYNEMLRARWEGLRDLKGVEEGLVEMQSRGVGWDKDSMRFATNLVEKLVELRLASLREKQTPGPPTAVSNDQRLVWAYGADVFERLARLEEMVESQVEFTEMRMRQTMKRRADKLREQEEAGMLAGSRVPQNVRNHDGHLATY